MSIIYYQASSDQDAAAEVEGADGRPPQSLGIHVQVGFLPPTGKFLCDFEKPSYTQHNRVAIFS